MVETDSEQRLHGFARRSIGEMMEYEDGPAGAGERRKAESTSVEHEREAAR